LFLALLPRVIPGLLQALGKSKESFVISSQLQAKNAWAASQKAAFNAFKQSLTADQSLFEAQQIRPCFLSFLHIPDRLYIIRYRYDIK
jgi:hypothetical protein